VVLCGGFSAEVRAKKMRQDGGAEFISASLVDGLLSVVYTEREDDVLRLISARKATDKERRAYERGHF